MKQLRVLMVTTTPPYPIRRSGAGQRTELLRRALAGCAELDFALLDRAEWHGEGALTLTDHLGRPRPHPTPASLGFPSGSRARNLLIRGLEYCWLRPLYSFRPDPLLAAQIRQVVAEGRYDAVVARYLVSVFVAELDRLGPVPCLLDLDDVDWEKWRQGRELLPWRFPLVKYLDGYLYRRFQRLGMTVLRGLSHLWVASDEDRSLLGLPNASVLPNLPFGPAVAAQWSPCPPERGSTSLLFVGDLYYPPNRTGLARFLRSVWPIVLAAVPGARVTVVGARLSPDIRRCCQESPSVDVVGCVDDLRPSYQQCAFAIAPIYSGGGTKIKVLEALSYGRTCVLTEHAAYGLDRSLLEGSTFLVAFDDRQYAQQCIHLLSDPDARDAMADRAYGAVMRAYSFASLAGRVATDVRGAVEGAARRLGTSP